MRGKGLMIGVELATEAAPVIAHMRKQGILLLQAGPNVLRLLPPFIITEEEIDWAVQALSKALDEAAQTV